jgi:hypothetical protein
VGTSQAAKASFSLLRGYPIEETDTRNPNYPFPRFSPGMPQCFRSRNSASAAQELVGNGEVEGREQFSSDDSSFRSKGGPAMRFVLTYSGPLPPDGGPAAKHRVRQALLPQLKQQLDSERALQNLAQLPSLDNPGEQRRLDDVSTTFTKSGFRFIPFVSREFNLVCNLEIKMARMGEEDATHSDDIDSRLKTLFDSLSVPVDGDQLRGLTPGREETPFYCLLEHRSLVTGFEIGSERLFKPQLDVADVRLTLVVTVRPTKITEENWSFAGGWS